MENIQKFNAILDLFKIQATCVDFKNNDSYCYYDLNLNSKTKVKDIQRFSDEISLMLKYPCKPNIKVLHNLGVVRLEFASQTFNKIDLFDYFTNHNIPKSGIPCLLGRKVDGEPVWMDLAQNPHLLIGGTTGSGKSVLMHNIIANLFNYNHVKLFLSDPKNIEFSEYEKINSSNLDVVYSYTETLEILKDLIMLMDSRYKDIRNGLNPDTLPYVVFIIDEFADLIMQDDNGIFSEMLCRLAQKSRAAKIHLIVSTQRPSANIINGSIKANFPARIACKVASHIDSKVILDSVGAENLLGKGDALLKDSSRHLDRFQIAYTTSSEVSNYFGGQ